MAEDALHQAKLAAEGVAKAGVAVGGAFSESAHRAVEHNFGKEADKVAQGMSMARRLEARLMLRKISDRPVRISVLPECLSVKVPALSCRARM